MSTRSVAVITVACLGLVSGASAVENGAPTSPKLTVHTAIVSLEDIEPDRFTLAKGDGLTFRNTRMDTVKVVFRGAGDVSKLITCKRPDGAPKSAGPDIKAMMGPEGNNLHLYVPPGLLGAACTFAPGTYTFDVVREVPLATDEVPPQAQVFAK